MSFRKERYSKYTQNTQNGVMWEWDEKDGSHNQFFPSLYLKILHERNIDLNKDTRIKNHELIGKKILVNGEERWVDTVHKHWDIGYYVVVLYYRIMENGGHSHGSFFYENINSHSPFVLDEIKKNQI